MKNPSQLFIIGDEVWNSLSMEEVNATCQGLKEMDLFHLPYERVNVRTHIDTTLDLLSNHRDFRAIMKDRWFEKYTKPRKDGTLAPNLGPNAYLEFRGVNLDDEEIEVLFVHMGDGVHPPTECVLGGRKDKGGFEKYNWNRAIASVLITILATDNAQKMTERNKLVSLGIGRGTKPGRPRKYEYTTTISLPRSLPEEERTEGDGKKRCPHLRRGHVRNQKYGPGFSSIRQIWISPMFIHADEAWVKSRTAYNLSKGTSS